MIWDVTQTTARRVGIGGHSLKRRKGTRQELQDSRLHFDTQEKCYHNSMPL